MSSPCHFLKRRPSHWTSSVLITVLSVILRAPIGVRLRPTPWSFDVVIFESFRMDIAFVAEALPQIPSAGLCITDHHYAFCWRTTLSQFNKHSGSKARFSWNTIKSAGMADFDMLELAFLIASTVVCPSS